MLTELRFGCIPRTTKPQLRPGSTPGRVMFVDYELGKETKCKRKGEYNRKSKKKEGRGIGKAKGKENFEVSDADTTKLLML